VSQPVYIRPCISGRDWRLFERIPEILHGDDPTFVPPVPGEVANLRGRSHDFSSIGTIRAYVAFRDGTPVGRIASILNRVHNEFHGDKVGFFGFFSFADREAAAPLLDRARDDLSKAGMETIRGPFNPTQNDECGVHVEGFGERPYFAMPFNPRTYPGVYTSLGLEPAMDMLAYRLDPALLEQFTARMGGIAERVRNRLQLSVRPVDPSRLDEEAALVSRLFEESLGGEWNFMPLTGAVAKTFARDLADHLDPQAVLIAEVDGEPAGLSIVLPDLNEFLAKVKPFPRWLRRPALLWLLKTRRCREARWAVLGLLPQYRKMGWPMVLLYDSVMFMSGRAKYESGEVSWTQATNPGVNRLVTQIGLVPSKTYRIYEMSLVGTSA